MHYRLFFILPVLLLTSLGRTEPVFEQGLNEFVVSAKGTGQTTGHIATLTLENNTDDTVKIILGPYLIPGFENEQGYIVPGTISITIPPGDKVEIPIYGYCTDIRRPPVGLGEDMPPLDTWITPETIERFNPDYYTIPEKGITPRDTHHGDVTITYPGTETPIPVGVDIDADPERAAPLLLTTIENITDAFETLDERGLINTPFSNDSVGEREAIIQQTFWIYTAALEDDEYIRGDFAENTIKQFESTTGREYDDLPVEAKEQLEIGIDQFWTTFTAVGIEAKVLADPETNITYPLESDSTIPAERDCGCTYSRITGVEVLQNGESLTDQTLLPGSYQFRAIIESDCEDPCELTIEGRWHITFVPTDGGAVLEYTGEGQTLDIDLDRPGSVRPRFRGTVFCDGEPCPMTQPSFYAEYEVDPCKCTNCRIVQPLKLYFKDSGEEITEDSIPWGLDVIAHPPEVASDCPDDCRPGNFVSIRHVPEYKYFNQSPSMWFNRPLWEEVLNPGQLRHEWRYRCYCEGRECGHREGSHTLVLTESNDCCDRIRQQSPGGNSLYFQLDDGQYVHMFLNQLIIHLNPGIRRTIYFDFNLEAMFCNLGENEVFGLFQSQSESRTSGGQTSEHFDISDLNLDHPTGEGSGADPHYMLSFSQSINGVEYQIVISIDERTCHYDISVLYEGDLFENEGPPNYTPSELVHEMEEVYNETLLERTSNRHFLNRMLHLLLQAMKGIEQGMEGYDDALISWRANMTVRINTMYRETNDPEFRRLLNELKRIIDDAESDPMDILHALMDAMSS